MSKKKLSCWAKEQGVHYRTALSWVRDGTMPIPVERTPGGHIRVIGSESVVGKTCRGGSRKRGLNRVLLDASFGEFRRLLEYKGRRYGCSVVAVPARHTSQRCSRCGCVDPKSRSTQSSFACTGCGFAINADLNAAINILVAGSCPETQNACGELVRPVSLRAGGRSSVKQESAVA